MDILSSRNDSPALTVGQERSIEVACNSVTFSDQLITVKAMGSVVSTVDEELLFRCNPGLNRAYCLGKATGGFSIEAMIEQPLTIYFDLSPDSRPTLGAVGAAMVQFEKMAEEAVFLMEPGVEFSMVYQYSAPGSLRIIAGLRGLVTAERLKDLALVVVTILVTNGVGHLQGKMMDDALEVIVGKEEKLSDEDIQRIAEAVRSVERSESVAAPRRRFYRAVEPDQAIAGVGAAANEKKERPSVVVPRAEFADRSGAIIDEALAGEPEPRVLSERVEVVLANVPLIETKAKWRIFSNGRPISVKMLDESFQHQILDGTTELRLASGVILDVTLETTQFYADGVWQNKSYAISEVHSWRQNPGQAELLLSHSSDDDDQNGQNAQ